MSTSRKLLLAANAAATVLAVAAGSSSGATVTPGLVSPTNAASLPAGVPFTFKSKAPSDVRVFLTVAKSKRVGPDGVLVGDLYSRTMQYRNGFHAKKVERYRYLDDHFLNRPGKYYWQTFQIECTVLGDDDCKVESKIRSFRIRKR